MQKINKNMIKTKLLKLAGRIKGKVSNYMNRNWQNTYPPVYWLVMLVICMLAGASTMNLFYQPVPGFLSGAVLAFLLANILLKLAEAVINYLKKLDVKHLLCGVVLLVISGELGADGNLGNDEEAGFVLGVIFGLAGILLVKSLWAFFRNKVYTPTIVLTGLISGAVFAGGCILLGGEGFSDSYIERYLNVAESAGTIHKEENAGFGKQFENGTYTVESIEYGVDTEVEIDSGTIDLSYCASNPDGLRGIWRSVVTDYDVERAPIAGKVWYPRETSNCPVLFFVHGNHGILTKSYLGYEYLGEYLASHGYVVVSVDENVLNMLSGENDARAILLLENIKKLQEFNREEDNPLYGKMDYDRIVIGGHSRGGEMAATAYLFNGYSCYPENGMRSFDYNFNIRGVIAVAPSVNQYKPADHEVALEDVNYLLIQGANDQDINVFMGTKQYENVKFTGDGDYIKSSLYIAGANHGQFNSLWGKYDLSAPTARYLNVGNFLEMEEQQNILKIYTKVFLDKVLNQDETYADLLTNQQAYREHLPETVYIQQYQRSGDTLLCNYEEDSELITASADGIMLDADHMRIWREEMLGYSNEDDWLERESYSLRLKWKNTKEAVYKLQMQNPVSLEQRGIALDICDMDDEKPGQDTYETICPQIVIRDADGKEAVIETADIVPIYPPLPVKLGKLQYLSGADEYKHQYQTVEITPELLRAQCASLDLSKITDIMLRFMENESGDINVDNIRITK